MGELEVAEPHYFIGVGGSGENKREGDGKDNGKHEGGVEATNHAQISFRR